MLEDWYYKARRVSAAHFAELKRTFGSADYVDGLTIFDVGGNHYRLVAIIHYDKQRIYVRRVMMHSEYDRDNWRNP